MIGRNEKGLVSVIYCCITNSPRAQWPETTNIISHSVWKSGIQEGLGYVVQAHLMVVGRFHFLAGNGLETSVPRMWASLQGCPSVLKTWQLVSSIVSAPKKGVTRREVTVSSVT